MIGFYCIRLPGRRRMLPWAVARMIVMGACILTMRTAGWSASSFPVVPSGGKAAAPKSIQRLGPLKSGDSNEDESSAMSEEDRMKMVRELQKTFYQSTDSEDRSKGEDSKGTFLDPSTGIMHNLPLWRVGWIELPGRSNCLNVHEPHYTNMFEKILNGPKPWYFGHLHLPGGTKAARTREARFDLKDWRQEMTDATRFDTVARDRSAVVGTLMRITDVRRIADGRLILLVHALDRFVVDQGLQTFPFGLANVQILPDAEFLPDGMDENFCKHARAKAVQDSIAYFDYEANHTMLPLAQDSEYLQGQGILGSAIAKVLPFCYFNPDDSSLPEPVDPASTNETAASNLGFAGGTPSLETHLQGALILRNPPPLPGVVEPRVTATKNVDTLETLTWLAVEDFCRATQFQLPQEILSLLPSHMDYLEESLGVPNIRLSDRYPAKRRQWRLSFSLSAIMESHPQFGSMRAVWLATPSTQARLAGVLERLELLNSQMLGEFQ